VLRRIFRSLPSGFLEEMIVQFLIFLVRALCLDCFALLDLVNLLISRENTACIRNIVRKLKMSTVWIIDAIECNNLSTDDERLEFLSIGIRWHWTFRMTSVCRLFQKEDCTRGGTLFTGTCHSNSHYRIFRNCSNETERLHVGLSCDTLTWRKFSCI
jgi:hypothetical protein